MYSDGAMIGIIAIATIVGVALGLIPIIFYFNGVHEDYHKATDEISKINFPMLSNRTKLVFYTAWEIANRTEPLRKDKKNDFENNR